MIDYAPIAIFDNVNLIYTDEACNCLLIAPIGTGKTMFLSYILSMTLKRGHRPYVVDCKNTSFGKISASIGLPTATTPKEMIRMLTDLVAQMEATYQNYFSSEHVRLDSNFKDFNLPAHVLIFDEVLAGLESGDKKENLEMVRLLKQLALKGRMAGFIIILSSQRLLATDLPKSITEQCQTRFLMGADVSDELFHTALGGYKKNCVGGYHGGVGKGYARTPKTGLTYFEAPYMDFSQVNFKHLLQKLKGGTG